ncbi:hypothetical protein MNV_50005 [Candidatus Methanoperedens nitroreducens]|uniref:Uncharacterized protein n=1 Tax=Candidatus Methanoperedens nitratireducens TaxID=1392998 RepID=A0A284VR35_9EURY|nr:hypothetical protein MNV_50005 [Candidatus Methanoperedens nitroreducens]
MSDLRRPKAVDDIKREFVEDYDRTKAASNEAKRITTLLFLEPL